MSSDHHDEYEGPLPLKHPGITAMIFTLAVFSAFVFAVYNVIINAHH